MSLKSAAFVGLFVLAAGMGSSAVLSSFSSITGEADVTGPTFYVAEVDNEQVLKVNEEPVASENFDFRSIGPDYSFEFFTSPQIEAGEWYEMRIDLYVKAKAMDSPGNIQADVLYDSESEKDILLCSTNIRVESTDEYREFSSSCTSRPESDIENSKVEEITYKLSGGEDKKFNIKPDGVTRFKVNKK